MTWEELRTDPELVKLPYDLESNEFGYAVMRLRGGASHSERQGEILRRLRDLMPNGHALPRYAVYTPHGVKVMDAAWVHPERHGQKAREGDAHFLAPEICVEVIIPDETPAETAWRFSLYFAAGAEECWSCDEQGTMTFSGPKGQMPRSKFCPEFPAQLSGNFAHA